MSDTKTQLYLQIFNHVKHISELQSDAAQDAIDLDVERDRVRELEAELSPLKEFAREVIKLVCWKGDMDGLSVQDLAEKLNLIQSHKATAEDVDDESDFEIGDSIFRFPKTLTLPTEKGGQ